MTTTPAENYLAQMEQEAGGFPASKVIGMHIVTSVAEAFALGAKVATAKTTNLLGHVYDPKQFPDEVREALETHGRGVRLRVIDHDIYANGSVSGQGNIALVAEPLACARWNGVNKKMEPYERPLVVIVLGCKHEFEGATVSRCYHRNQCKRCQYTYFVDSSD